MVGIVCESRINALPYGIGGIFNTRKGKFQYKISLYIIIYPFGSKSWSKYRGYIGRPTLSLPLSPDIRVPPEHLFERASPDPRGVDGGVTATGVLSRERGNLITIDYHLYYALLAR